LSNRLSARERSLRQKLKDVFEHYAPKCLKIRTKAGGIEPFTLNRSQRYLHEKLEAQERRMGRVRALVLKGRQVGISTYIGGRFFWKLTHRKGFRAFILTHLDQATDNLFEMAKRFYDNCPPLVRPSKGLANAKEMTFPGLQAGYKVATAGSKGVGRSDTLQLIHGSEVGFWVNAEDHFSGLMQALADADGTEAILESTANGIGNKFHALWKAAERGDSEFEAIFIPWFWHEEYVRAAPEDWYPPGEWEEYERSYELTREQTYWAFCKSRELAAVAGGEPDKICWKFKQEYPANADEAFQTSGEEKKFIKPQQVLRARKAKVEGYGPIVLGVDPARGGGDKTALIDRQGRRMGAHVRRKIDQRDLMAVAGDIVKTVREMKENGVEIAKVVIDTTGLGAGLYDRLRELIPDLVEGVNFAEAAHDPKRYANRRAEMWDLKRQWYDDKAGVQVPDDDEFQGDECAVEWGKGATHFNSNAQLVLESKDHIRENVGFSPDYGDAAALTFAVDMTLIVQRDWSINMPRGTGGWLAS